MHVHKIIAQHFKQHQAKFILNDSSYCCALQLKSHATIRLLSALQQCVQHMSNIAVQTAMEIMVNDLSGRMIWSASTPLMRSQARPAHFRLGAQWDEQNMGMNACMKVIKTGKSACVMGQEHQSCALHDLICYAAPIIDPVSQVLLGVINLAIQSEQYNVLGMLAAEQCAITIENKIRDQQQAHLRIDTRSDIQIFLNDEILQITPQQKEIICILAIHPQGIELNHLHQALYGERKTSIDTLKAEIGKIKRILKGLIRPRSYQLLLHVEADFLNIEQALDSGQLQYAKQLYQQNCLANVRSPVLVAWKACLSSRFTTTALQQHSVYWAEQQYC